MSSEGTSSSATDPLSVLPTELVLHICSFLPPEDLLTTGQLSRRWRSLTRDPQVWRHVNLYLLYNFPPRTIPVFAGRRKTSLFSPVPIRVLRAAPFVKTLRLDACIGKEQEQALMETAATVARIKIDSTSFTKWSIVLKVVNKFAVSLESLSLQCVSRDMLRFLAEEPFPRLQTLKLGLDYKYERAGPSDWTYQDRGPGASTLTKLVCEGLDEQHVYAVSSLLSRHRHTLREAVARCEQLEHAMLPPCGAHLSLLAALPALRSLRLKVDACDDESRGKPWLDLLPPGLQKLSVSFCSYNLESVLADLKRAAPRLRTLHALSVEWFSPKDAQEAERVLVPLLPGVQQTHDFSDAWSAGDENEQLEWSEGDEQWSEGDEQWAEDDEDVEEDDGDANFDALA
ncbi:uncharacterized protein LOC117645490 isoform X2 [Thrips palmi]|uniref:Uncharacterized protein LOC117645490 isoform X2 n=1 Tax=Thrips palmi TaxID=161013 RepID=A0A6P8YWJ7_THRPL|nr:uncharacterized protein LOC117645490 isoform X2 [Thrips palmi]